RIEHVLRGWNPEGGPAVHDFTFRDVRVRNVPTNIRTWDGGTMPYGNSIFVFEIAGLCIAHLGHLHHTLTTQQLAQIGQMDVVLVPVDGSFTLDLDGMLEVLRALKAPLVIPMHYFSSFTLNRFLSRIEDSFEVVRSEVPTTVISRATFPRSPQVLVLPGHCHGVSALTDCRIDSSAPSVEQGTRPCLPPRDTRAPSPSSTLARRLLRLRALRRDQNEAFGTLVLAPGRTVISDDERGARVKQSGHRHRFAAILERDLIEDLVSAPRDEVRLAAVAAHSR